MIPSNIKVALKAILCSTTALMDLQGVSKVCILRKALNASLGKCKLIQVRNLSK